MAKETHKATNHTTKSIHSDSLDIINTIASIDNRHSTPNSIPPAQLWIGSGTGLLDNLHAYLCEIFCPQANAQIAHTKDSQANSPDHAQAKSPAYAQANSQTACLICATCTQIQTHEHYAIKWFAPEKSYTLETIEDLFSTIRYQLEPGEKSFFILQNAEFLSPTCANSLLKSMEEPPLGYHFILLCARPDLILPTIKSRCTFINHSTPHTVSQHTHADLFQFFSENSLTGPKDPSAFLKAIDHSKINERESIELLDALLAHWTAAYCNALKEDQSMQDTNNSQNPHSARKNTQNTKHAKHVITALERAIMHPPMPGSSKLFWKNLFLQTTIQ